MCKALDWKRSKIFVLEVEARPARKADSFIAICEPIV
jgi:hypothetical protein